MKTFQFNKLVRDKIPEEIQRNKFLAELIKKISEEMSVRREKNKTQGAFTKRIFISHVRVPVI